MSLRFAGKMDAAKIFSEALETAQTRELIIRKAWAAHDTNILVPYTPEEALSLFTEAHLTKKSLHKMSKSSTNENCNCCTPAHQDPEGTFWGIFILVDYLLYLSLVLDLCCYHTLNCEPRSVSRACLAAGLSV